MKKKTLIILSILILITITSIYLYRRFHAKPPVNQFAKNAVFVSTQVVKASTWVAQLQAIGTVRAAKSIDVSTDASGIVTTIAFRSGQQVQAGQLLVKLRTDSVESALTKAKIALQNDLKNYQRFKALLPSHYVSQSDIDTLRATIAKDKADVAQQQASLNQLIIKAPFTGYLGIRQIEVGQYLPAGQAIVNLESLDTVYVDFDVSERFIDKVKVGDQITVSSGSYTNKQFTGKILALSHAIDAKNRSLKVRAQVENPNQLLLTGMSVNVIVGNRQANQIIIPQTALNYGPKGTGVYVIDAKNTVHWRAVSVGERQQNLASITKGLRAGEKIVTAGQQKLREGSQIVENNDDLLV